MERLAAEVGIRRDKWLRQTSSLAMQAKLARERFDQKLNSKDRHQLEAEVLGIEKEFWQQYGALCEAEFIYKMIQDRLKQEETVGLHEAGI